MGLNFRKIYNGGRIKINYSKRSGKKQLTPQNILFLKQIGLKDKSHYGNARHKW
jgi:hypothetical protein